MIFALLLVVVPAAGWWSYRVQREAAGVLHDRRVLSPTVHHPSSEPVSEETAAPEETAASEETAAAAAAVASAGQAAQTGPATATVRQLERPAGQPCTSVLGWDAFTLAATLLYDGTLMLSCRRDDRAAEPEELTVVLHIGDDERADQAATLFEWWRASGTILRVRPTTVAGAIDILDERQRIVRAPLLRA